MDSIILSEQNDQLRRQINQCKADVAEAHYALKALLDAYEPDGHSEHFATGPLTGDPFQDYIGCPGCYAEKLTTEALEKTNPVAQEIKNLRQQLDQREAEVAMQFRALQIYSNEEREKAILYTQATAEAHDAKVWNEAVNAVLKFRYLIDKNDSPDKDKIDAVDVEALLKPESEAS